jgi:curli biogenesis system outer membrane secretion channel CsgG
MRMSRARGRASRGLVAAVALGVLAIDTVQCLAAGSPYPSSQPAAPSPPPVAAPPPAAAAPMPPPAPTLAGPKRVIAVGKFDSTGAFNAKYGQWDIGGGLSAMLTTALADSGQFVVVERAYVQQLLTEEQLKANGIVKAETGPRLGQMTGAQLLIFGAVTEFGTDDSGGGFSVGFAGGGGGGFGAPTSPFGTTTGGFGGAPATASIGTQNAKGAVGMDLRIVDTTSGQVLQTVKVKEAISASSFNANVGYKGISFGDNEFNKTPLGEATRHAIERAVAEITASASHQPWQGQIVEFDGHNIIINAGRNSGVRPGDRFTIQRIAQRLTDPTTGEVLSVKRQQLGTVQVTSIEDKIASGPYVALTPDQPKRGDIVVMEP